MPMSSEYHSLEEHKLLKMKIALLLCIIVFAMSGCEKIRDTVVPDAPVSDVAPLTVMTYNVYVGASTDPLLTVANLGEVPAAVAALYTKVMAADFPGRAAAIAASIKASEPHLIGLQEISIIRRQTPGDLLAGGDVPAEDVVLDFLEILMAALKNEGLNYHVAAKVENFDVEVPLFTETGIDDARLTDYDVILVSEDVQVSRIMSATYSDLFVVEAFDLEAPRGYVALDATVAGATYRVVNTHLEFLDADIRVAQAQELVESLRDETLPVILLGDFNTPAPDGAAYQLLLSAGYVDVWQMDAQGTGFTCCQADNLQNAESELSERIDQIFVRNLELPASVLTHTVGDKPSERLPAGLWPSDHAGVVVHLPIE